MSGFKETEMSRVRLEEQRKSRETLEKWMEDYEKSYSQRIEKLKQREDELVETVKRKQRVSLLFVYVLTLLGA